MAGIVGRADVLACLLFLLAFLSYNRYVWLRMPLSVFTVMLFPGSFCYVCVCVCVCVASELLPERGGKLLGCEITVSFLETWHRKLSLSQRLGCCVFQLYSELCHSLLKGLLSQCWEDKL